MRPPSSAAAAAVFCGTALDTGCAAAATAGAVTAGVGGVVAEAAGVEFTTRVAAVATTASSAGAGL